MVGDGNPCCELVIGAIDKRSGTHDDFAPAREGPYVSQGVRMRKLFDEAFCNFSHGYRSDLFLNH